MLERDRQRLQDVRKRVNWSPPERRLWPERRCRSIDALAAALGFDGIYANSLDAVSDRDFTVEFLRLHPC